LFTILKPNLRKSSGISEEKPAIIPLYHIEGHFGSPIPPKKTQEANVYAI
jgi:hypothetical protein